MLRFDPDKCPTKILAGCIGISADRVGRLHRQGILTQTARGKYDLLAACKAYRRYKETSRPAPDYSAAALDLKREQARKTKIANEGVLARLMDVDDVQAAVNEITHIFASMMEGLPDRVAELVVDMTDPGELRTRILTETRAIRTRVAGELDSHSDS